MTDSTRMKVCGGLSAALIAAVLAFGSPVAMAQLPGGSAADAYTENVPGAGGDQPSGGNGGGTDTSGSGDSSGSSAPATTQSASSPGSASSSGSLSASGTNGNAGVGSSGSTPTGASGGSGGPPLSDGRAPDVPATLTSQPVPVATDRPGNSRDISAAWPIALLVVALASVGIYWYRRRYPETLIQRPGRTPHRLLG